MTPTYRPLPQRIALAINRHPDTIAAVTLALATFIGAIACLVLHPALYLV